jgi:hypothetical protein
VTLHVSLPLQAPAHPENVEPCTGVAVSVTTEPAAKVAAHVCPQLIPAGLLEIEPAP